MTNEKFISDRQYDFDDVLIKQQSSSVKSRSDVSLEVSYTFKHSNKTYYGIPVMASNMGAIGTFEMADTLSKNNMFTNIRKYYTKQEWNNYLHNTEDVSNIAVSCGMKVEDYNKMNYILDYRKDINFICLDIANGGIDQFAIHVNKIRTLYPDKTLIAGNVSTEELTEKLINSGADIVKLGIGPGSACTTRKKAGVGRPQLSTILECSKVAHSLGAHVIGDGGIKETGHVGIAFGAGADFVMLGGMLSGTDEAFGKKFEADGKIYKKFYGDSSGDKDVNPVSLAGTSEGRKLLVESKGSVENIVDDIKGGLRSTCTYTNTRSLEELKEKVQFYIINPSNKLNTSLLQNSISIENLKNFER